jgi:hypothetical protein
VIQNNDILIQNNEITSVLKSRGVSCLCFVHNDRQKSCRIQFRQAKVPCLALLLVLISGENPARLGQGAFRVVSQEF